jgi:hypothetical protein
LSRLGGKRKIKGGRNQTLAYIIRLSIKIGGSWVRKYFLKIETKIKRWAIWIGAVDVLGESWYF